MKSKTNTGFYPKAVQALGEEKINQIQEGSLLTVKYSSPMIDYIETWIVVDPSKVLMLSNDMAVMPYSYETHIDDPIEEDLQNLAPIDIIDQWFNFRRKDKRTNRRKPHKQNE